MTRARERTTTDSARGRLLEFLAEHRGEHASVREIANAVGCSRQYVYSWFPSGYQTRPNVEHERQTFLDAHREAVLPKARGGITFKEIAAQLGVSPQVIGRLWRLLDLPDRAQFKLSPQEMSHRKYDRHKKEHQQKTRQWRERNGGKERAIRRRANRRWSAKAIRDERCVVCQSFFPWTNAHEKSRRQQGRPIACSRRCSIKARAEARRLASAG